MTPSVISSLIPPEPRYWCNAYGTRDWDDPQLLEDLLTLWCEWEKEELGTLEDISLPRCYFSSQMDHLSCRRDIHIFCDASEQAYGAVAYLRSENNEGQVEVTFMATRSRAAPRKQQSIPRLELCAALSGAQLSKLLVRLITRDYDERLCHPGSERLFDKIRRTYWILRGREAIRRHQHQCVKCRKWIGRPEVPLMADLPLTRQRYFKPVFYSTGMDCFGPFVIKIGHRNEKRWGVVCKCMTIRAVHLDILHSIDSDSFLMALRRFITRRGKPYELLCDQCTNFKGGERKLSESFAAMQGELQSHLASQHIKFVYNPPGAPHFGGCWEREIRSIKAALKVTIGAQTVTEEVLKTVLVEVEGVLNSKPLGYTSLDVADLDPITPFCFLIGRQDASSPQVVYQNSEILSRRHWRHSQLLADHFWRHFLKYYLPSLQARQKWRTDKRTLEIGNVVMIVNPQLPRALWPVGKVTVVFPGSDGKIRTASVDVKGRTYTRVVARRIQLPALSEYD